MCQDGGPSRPLRTSGLIHPGKKVVEMVEVSPWGFKSCPFPMKLGLPKTGAGSVGESQTHHLGIQSGLPSSNGGALPFLPYRINSAQEFEAGRSPSEEPDTK